MSTEKNHLANDGNVSTGYTVEQDWCSVDAPKCNPIQDRGDCRVSGGAFAAIAAIETGLYITQEKDSPTVTPTLQKLSVQECLDCAYSQLAGCTSASTSYQCVNQAAQEATPINLEKDYPYTGINQECQELTTGGPAYVSNTGQPPVDNPTTQDMTTMLDSGPVLSKVDSNCSLFSHYAGGILCSSCTSEITTDHPVLIVGYGSFIGKKESSATEYFIVRNSWGADWGEDGYIWLCFDNTKGSSGVLGIQMQTSQIEVEPTDPSQLQ